MKKVIIIFIPVLILLVLGGVLVAKNPGSSPQKPPVAPTPTPESTLIEELTETNPYGVEVTPRFDKKAVFLKITSFPAGLKTIDYEITYEAKERLNDVTRGAVGTITYKDEDKIQREILLGTCSKNVCRYDEGVVEVTLSIVFRGDKTGKFQGTFSLK